MTAKTLQTKKNRRSFSRLYLAFGLFGGALISFILFAHPFLAVTQRVDADVLVVEGWIPDYMLPPATSEFLQGKYSLLFVSGLQNDPTESTTSVPDAQRAAARLETLGVPPAALVPCPAPFANWLRTSKTAHAVRDKIVELGLKPKGINVVTAGPHARETWVAYQHAFGPGMPVGIISIPKTNYPADRWWLSRQGLIWVPKDFIAWLKEVLFGLRS
jgi:hypothetical protein